MYHVMVVVNLVKVLVGLIVVVHRVVPLVIVDVEKAVLLLVVLLVKIVLARRIVHLDAKITQVKDLVM